MDFLKEASSNYFVDALVPLMDIYSLLIKQEKRIVMASLKHIGLSIICLIVYVNVGIQ